MTPAEVEQLRKPAPVPADDTEGPDDAPTAVLPAHEALERLRTGVGLENVRVEKLHLRGEFDLPIHLKRVHLVQPRFDGAVFKADVTMAHCTIDRPVFGRAVEFQRSWNVVYCNLNRFQALRVTVKGIFNAEYTQCRNKFAMSNCRFEGKVRFWETRFLGWCEFGKCEFVGEADFRSLHAEEGFVWKDCQFLSDCLFRGAAVAKKFDATNSRFESILDLSKAKLHDYAYLENIQQGEKQRFAFENTVGERVRVRTEQLEGRLASEDKGNFDTAMHEYAFLKLSYQTLHRYDEEDWAFYRFKVNQRRARLRCWTKPWTKCGQFCDWLLLDHGCGYCTDPFRAVRTAIIIILVFAAIYAVGIDAFDFTNKQMPFVGAPTDLGNRVVIGLFKSVACFTSGLSTISDMSRGWMNVPLMLESLLGTLLWGLFIVAFSRKVIR
jgi:hypothetical protein